ncbi:MAG: hypothetical protein HC853_04430, partial [Anaerolineae bacterium]|nr:hypothetical protein [Anaerolineae bacterium]
MSKMMMTYTTQATIQHMTLRWAGSASEARTPATALRVENLLNQAHWQPRAMRSGEILLIRRLRLPAALYTLRLHPLAHAELDAALAQALDDAYRTAAHPAAGQGWPRANAIVFEDAAALLMYLTHEVLAAGSSAPALAVQRWYWPQVIGRERADTPSAMLATLWGRYAAHVPAALVGISPQQAHHACGLLDPADARRVWQALAIAYALPQLLVALEDGSNASNVPPSATARRAIEPWAKWSLPDATAPTRAQLLLGVCAVLRQAPAYGRSAKFAAQVVAWWQAQFSTAPPLGQQADEMTAHQVASWEANDDSLNPTTQAQQRGQRSQADAALPLTTTADLDEASGEGDRQINEAMTTQHDQHSTSSHPTHQATPFASDLPTQPPNILGDEMTQGVSDVDELVEAADEAWLALPEGVKTRLGGVFFLINVLKPLELPDALSEVMNRWDVIAALAQRLLGSFAMTDEYADDPVWVLLAHLASHEAHPTMAVAKSVVRGGRPPPLRRHRSSAPSPVRTGEGRAGHSTPPP